MPSHPQLVNCHQCKSPVPYDDDNCRRCGADFRSPASLPDDQDDFELGSSNAGQLQNEELSGLNGIFQMADDVGDQAHDDFSPPQTKQTLAPRSESASKPAQIDFSDVFNLAEDVSDRDANVKSLEIPRVNGVSVPRQDAATLGSSGVFDMAEDARTRTEQVDFSTTAGSRQSVESSRKPTAEPVSISRSDSMETIDIDSETPLPKNRQSTHSQRSDVIRLSCKTCGRKLRVKKDRAGHRIKCPKCQTKLTVPGQQESSADAPSPNAGNSQSNHDVSFAEIAKQLRVQETQEASSGSKRLDAPEKDKADNKKSSKAKKPLPNRKFRQLTSLLETKDALSADGVRFRADALRELGQSGDPKAYELLVADLEHSELKIRQAALVGLGELADLRCVPLLVALLDDNSMVIRKAAILGLGKVKDSRAIHPLLLFGLGDPQMKFLASEAVADMKDEAVQPLIELLDHSELGIVLEAVVLLGRLKDARARRALTAVIDARQPLLQCHAIESLGQIGDPKSIGPLSRLLQSFDANIRMTAAAALSKMASDKNVVAPLVKSLKDPDEDVVVQAAVGLAESGDKRAAEPLSRLLNSPQEKLRMASAQALGALGDQRAVPHLLALLEDESEDIQVKVLTSLRAMKSPHIAGSLLKFLGNRSPAIRRRVVDVLGPIGDAEVAEQLEHILSADAASEVRMAAARALGEIADPASVQCLQNALHNDEFNVRCQAVGALGSIGDDECYKTLIALLEDPVSEIRFHAAAALGDIGNKQAVPNLKELLKDKNPMVVRGASKSLEKLGITNVETHVKHAQRSQRREAFHNLLDTVKSWLPDTAHAQKIIFGGALAGLLLILGLGWLLYAMFQPQPDRVVRRGYVRSISFMPDGETMAVGRTFGVVEIWNANSARLKDKLTPQNGQQVIATPNPDVLALINGKAIQLWKVGDTNELPPTSGHDQPITRYVVTSDHALVGTLSTDGVAIQWDLETGQHFKPVQLSAKDLVGFTMSADGSLFAGGNSEGQITIWNAETGEAAARFQQGSTIDSMSFSPDEKQLAVACRDFIDIWSLETSARLVSLTGFNGIGQLLYSPDGQFLVGTQGTMLLVWKVGTFTEAQVQSHEIQVPVEELTVIEFSPDGSKIAVGGSKNSPLWIFDPNNGQEIQQLDQR